MKKRAAKSKDENRMKALYVAIVAAIFPVMLSYIQMSNPFLINPEVMKFVAFSVSLLIPVIFDILVAKAGIVLSDAGFFAMSYVIYAVLFYVILHFYYKSKTKDAFIKKSLIALAIYIALVVQLMW